MSPEPGPATGDSRRLHDIRNHLSVVIGFCDLLLGKIPEHDRMHADILEMRKAAQTAMGLLDGLRETL